MFLLPPELAGVIDALVRSVQEGAIPESRINDSARRVLELKARLGLQNNRFIDIGLLPQKIASRPHLEQAARTFEKSVTLVKNDRDVLPISPEIPAEKIAVLSLIRAADGYF